MIKSIVFDLDDTLYPEREFRQSGFEAVADFINQQGNFGVTAKKLLSLNKKYPGRCFDALIEREKLSISADTLVDIYRNHQPRITPFPHIKQILAKLKSKYGLKLGLLTDYHYRSQINKLKVLKIAKFFDALIFTDQINAPKPNSLGFALVKKKFKCKDLAIIYVGDNEKKDFIGAHKSGFITVKFNNKNGFYSKIRLGPANRANYEINRHQELFDIIDRLNGLSKPKLKISKQK